MKNCSKCGAELPDEAKFCAECGEKSESVNQQEPVKALPEEKPAEPSSVSEAVSEPAKEASPASEPVPAKKKKFPVVPVIIGGAAILAAAGTAVYFTVVEPAKDYNSGVSAEADGAYEDAITFYEAAGNYKDAKQRASEVTVLMHYEKGIKAFNDGDFDKAKEELTAAGDYKDAQDKLKECEPASQDRKSVV